MKVNYPIESKYQTEDEYNQACHESFEQALRKFKRESKPIIQEAKRRQYFESKSEIKRRQKKRAIRKEKAMRLKEEMELETSMY